MNPLIWLLIILLLLFAYFYPRLAKWWAERKRLIEMVDRIPGPPSIPILGCAHIFKFNMEEFSKQILDFSKDYQKLGLPLTRIWLGPFPVVNTFSPESVKCVLESTTVITKGAEYNILKRWLGTGLLTSTGLKWRTRRKMLTPAFHFSILTRFLSIHDKESQIFVKEIEKYADSDETFDIFPYIKRCALDIISETSMGTKVDAQTDHNHYYVNAVQKMNQLSFRYTRFPWLWIKPIWYAFGYGSDYDKNLKIVTDFTLKVIGDRRKQFFDVAAKKIPKFGEKMHYAFLDLLLNLQAEDPLSLNDEDIREEVDTFMFEGHDTTSSGMAWSLWCLAHNLECQERVIEEVDLIFGNSNRECTTEDLTQLKYLEKCIKEALRLFPPVPMYTRMVFEDLECAGHIIPYGSTVLVSPFILHRDERLYENADSYNPENFSQENIAKRHPYAYVPFSAGLRNCIGQKFAIMEEKTVLSWFFRRYRITSKRPFEYNVPLPEIILKPSKGVPVQIFKR